MHMICIRKWRLPGCVRNKHSKIFSTEKPLLQRKTLKFVWTLVRSKSASPDGAVDLHPRRVRPRPSHLSVLLPPHHPSHYQSCLRDIPGEATTRHSDSPSLPASLPGAGADGGSVSCQEEVMGPSVQNGPSQQSREGKETSPPRPKGMLVNPCWSTKSLSTCLQSGVLLWRRLGGS